MLARISGRKFRMLFILLIIGFQLISSINATDLFARLFISCLTALPISLEERLAHASVKISIKKPSKVFNTEHTKSFSYGSLNLDIFKISL